MHLLQLNIVKSGSAVHVRTHPFSVPCSFHQYRNCHARGGVHENSLKSILGAMIYKGPCLTAGRINTESQCSCFAQWNIEDGTSQCVDEFRRTAEACFLEVESACIVDNSGDHFHSKHPKHMFPPWTREDPVTGAAGSSRETEEGHWTGKRSMEWVRNRHRRLIRRSFGVLHTERQ